MRDEQVTSGEAASLTSTNEVSVPRGGLPSATLLMVARLHRSREFTVENALQDFSEVVAVDLPPTRKAGGLG